MNSDDFLSKVNLPGTTATAAAGLDFDHLSDNDLGGHLRHDSEVNATCMPQELSSGLEWRVRIG